MSYYLTDAGSSYLMEAQVSVIDAADCNNSVAYNGKLSEDMLCATEMEAAADMCRVRQTFNTHTHTRAHTHTHTHKHFSPRGVKMLKIKILKPTQIKLLN